MLATAAQRLGLFVMGTAMVLSTVELSNEAKRIVLPNQPAPVWVGENEDTNNPIRREREETAPHFISYTEVQRTASRSGRG
jgi:hypothetical protein